jgi:hypothetical protein
MKNSKKQITDILVADGHIMNLKNIKPYDPKVKPTEKFFHAICSDLKTGMLIGSSISSAEDTKSIKECLNKAISSLGKTPGIIITDNGRAFTSNSKRIVPTRRGSVLVSGNQQFEI